MVAFKKLRRCKGLSRFGAKTVTMLKSVRRAIMVAVLFALSSTSASAGPVIHARIEGMIDGGVAAYVNRVVLQAVIDSADAIVLEMDTYGGRVDAADAIRKELLDTDVPTITWVHPNAASAGALIALSTDTIVMSPGSAIGAATPVSGTTGQVASSKVISYFRVIMGETATATGRDPVIAEAMVDSSVTVPGLESAPHPLTLGATQAISIGIAQQMASTLEEVLEQNGLTDAEIILIESDWAEDVVRFLTNPMISGLLMTIGALGLIYELTSPGFGIAGTAGLVSLILFFGSHWIIKLAEVPELVLFVVGLGLIIAEFFVPGGILGIVGGVAVLASLILSMLPGFELVGVEELSRAVTSLGMAVILTFIGAVIVLRSFVELPVFKRFLLETRQSADKGTPSRDEVKSHLVGVEGTASTPLRPAGTAVFGGRYYDVTTEGEHIERGAPIKVVSVDGLRIVVREI